MSKTDFPPQLLKIDVLLCYNVMYYRDWNLFVFSALTLNIKHICFYKEERKKFDKLTAKFYQSQERNLNLKTKNSNTDAVKEVTLTPVLHTRRHFPNYVLLEYILYGDAPIGFKELMYLLFHLKEPFLSNIYTCDVF